MPFKPLKHIGPKIGSTNSSSLTTSTTTAAAAATKADNQQHFSSSSLLESTLNETSNSSSTEPMAPKLPPKPVREQVRVIYGYKAQNEDELTIKEGDIITVISKDNEDMGWWKGELNGRIALFPDNFVEIIQPSPPPPLPRPIVIDKSENVDKFVRVKKPDRIGTSISSSSNEQQQQQTTTTATTISSQTIPVIGKSLKISNGKSSISNVQDNTDVSMITDDVDNGREDPFNQSEPISPSRLVHLTAQRPKIPSNSRRPPSMHLGKSMNDQSNDSYNMDSLDDAGSETVNNTVINKKTSLKPTPKPQQQQQQQQQSQMQILESEANLNNSGSSPEKKAPWLSELKKSQERRRTQESSSFGDRKSVINGLSSTTTSSTMSTLSSSSTANSSNISVWDMIQLLAYHHHHHLMMK
ncbi:SH3-domain kinase binding protein 1 [Blomia tropicalis]|nr:SH3-domain kinase binding protein 1 [Blomia tropicalis]